MFTMFNLLHPLEYLRTCGRKNKMPGVKRTRAGLSVVTAPGRRFARTFRKRVARRKYARTKRGRVSPNYSFHRWITSVAGINVTTCSYDIGSSVLSATAANTTSAFSILFKLSDLPNVTEFTTLFDSYMITGVMMQIKMISNPYSAYPVNGSSSSATINSNNFFPTIWYVADHDDNTTLSLAQIKEYDKVRHKVLRPNQETNIMLRPTTLQQLYRSSVTTGYAENRRRQWLDIGATDIPHYGIKSVIDFEGLTPVGSFEFKINFKYYFKCKNVR